MNENISIIIPIFNESSNIKQIKKEIFYHLQDFNFEIIFINDASNDDSHIYLNNFSTLENIKILNNSKNLGQSKSLQKGIIKSTYDTIVTIDGDCQNDPKDILKLLKIYFSKDNINVTFVSGVRAKRKDNLIKIFSSKIANKVRNFFLKDGCPDTGCSLKVFPKEYFLRIPFFNGMHRFLPALFIGLNLRPYYVNVSHRKRVIGFSKYGTFGRLIVGIILLFKVRKIIKNFN